MMPGALRAASMTSSGSVEPRFFKATSHVLALPLEAELEARVGAIENGERRIGDFRADPVAGQHQNFHDETVR